MSKCRHCKSGNTNTKGTCSRTGKQRYFCKDCKRHFIREFELDRFWSGKRNDRAYVCISPSLEEFKTRNLAQFCREKGLAQPRMHYVLKGKAAHHRGWRCRYEEA